MADRPSRIARLAEKIAASAGVSVTARMLEVLEAEGVLEAFEDQEILENRKSRGRAAAKRYRDRRRRE